MTDDPFACNELRDVAAELAVGALGGGERARAVAHLSVCPGCRQEAAELTRVADDLLLLAPETEPPPGFESRVQTHLAEHRRPGGRASRPRVRMLVAAAALVVAALGGGVLARITAPDDGPTPVRTALALSASGRSTCRVVVTGGDPASLVLTLDGPAGRATEYVVEAQPREGRAIPVGRFSLTDGRGMLAATVGVDGADLRSVRVFDAEGELLYEAFPSDRSAPAAPISPASPAPTGGG